MKRDSKSEEKDAALSGRITEKDLDEFLDDLAGAASKEDEKVSESSAFFHMTEDEKKKGVSDLDDRPPVDLVEAFSFVVGGASHATTREDVHRIISNELALDPTLSASQLRYWMANKLSSLIRGLTVKTLYNKKVRIVFIDKAGSQDVDSSQRRKIAYKLKVLQYASVHVRNEELFARKDSSHSFDVEGNIARIYALLTEMFSSFESLTAPAENDAWKRVIVMYEAGLAKSRQQAREYMQRT